MKSITRADGVTIFQGLEKGEGPFSNPWKNTSAHAVRWETLVLSRYEL